MGSKANKGPRIHIERGAPDRILPKHFIRILSRRFFPVMALTYLSSVVGIAVKKGDLKTYLFENYLAYELGLFAAAWVSIPAILWIVLRGSHLFNHVANVWYWICAVLMSTTLFLSYFLLPEADFHGVRAYFAATIPMMFVMYFFLVKQPLSAGISYFLTAAGIAALLFGAWIKFNGG